MMEKITRRKDTYRPVFCARSFYIDHAKDFQVVEKYIETLKLSEQITVWVITCSCLRRVNSWYGGLRAEIFSEIYSDRFSLFNLFQDLKILWPARLPKDISLREFCRTVRIAPLPLAAMNALHHFHSETYPLKVLCYEPTPLELMELQIRGLRVLTFEKDFSLWPDLKYGERDPLSFWIHDLIHAEHFFSDQKNLRGQIGFYYLVKNILENKILDDILLKIEFNEAFSYLISDMNSHPVHLIKTLKAHIQIHESEQNAGISLWERVTTMPIISSNDVIAKTFKGVNTCNFTKDDAMTLTEFMEQDLYNFTVS